MADITDDLRRQRASTKAVRFENKRLAEDAGSLRRSVRGVGGLGGGWVRLGGLHAQLGRGCRITQTIGAWAGWAGWGLGGGWVRAEWGLGEGWVGCMHSWAEDAGSLR